MKILIINTVETGKNGITNVIFNYLYALNSSNIDFDYVAINDSEKMYIENIEAQNGRFYVVRRTGKNLLSYIIKLKYIISENNYDVVHIHTNSHTCVLELFAAKLGGCKKRIVHAHSTQCEHLIIHNILSGVFNQLCTCGFACGYKAGKFMFENHPFKIINNGVDTQKFAFNLEMRRKIRNQNNLRDEDIVIGHVGYFLELKNQKFIVEIFNILFKRNKNYKLLFIGDGHLRRDVERKVAYYGLTDNVIFTGNINNVSEYLNAMDLVVMPSLYEGLPLTLIEQQANGLHCVVSDTITREVDKTGNITFLSLNDGIDKWVKEVERESVHSDRLTSSRNAIQQIKNAGYSMQEEAKKLEENYLNL